MQQLARKIKEEGGRNGNSQEGQLDEMLLFCITQFLGELALIVSDHTLYRPHKLIGLNKELAKMAKVLLTAVRVWCVCGVCLADVSTGCGGACRFCRA
jgi:hypothetical protein